MKWKIFFILLLIIPFAASKETQFYGQVLLGEGTYDTVEISANWLDDSGLFHTTRTRTLSENDALALGDLNLRNFYFFNNNVNPKEGTNVVFTLTNVPYKLILSPPYEQNERLPTIAFVLSQSGEKSQNNSNPVTFQSHDETDMKELIIPKNNQTINIPTTKNKIINTTDAVLPITPKEKSNLSLKLPQIVNVSNVKEKKIFFSDILKAIGLILALISSIFIIYYFIKYSSNYIVKAVILLTRSPVSFRSERILNIKARQLATPIKSVSIDKKFTDAIVEAIDFEKVFVTKNNQIIGYIPRSSMIKNAEKSELKIKEVDDLIIKDIPSIDANKTMVDAFFEMRAQGISSLVLVDDAPIGQITLDNIQRQIKIIGDAGTPTLRDVLEKNYDSLDIKDNITQAMILFTEKNAKFILVTDDTLPVGVLTYIDYLRGILKYTKNLDKNSVGSIMSTRIAKIDPDMNVMDASNLMLEKGYREFPVLVREEILGIVTQDKICEALISILKENAKN